MTKRTLLAAAVAMGLALPAAYAEDAMKPAMAKDKMEKSGMMDKKDTMSKPSDSMKKSDGMMDKKDNMAKDGMKK